MTLWSVVPGFAPAPQDSVVVQSPLPGGVAEFVRFLFGIPQWIQIVGFFAGVAVAGVVAWQLWKRRRPILQWVGTRERGVKIGLAVAVVVALVSVAGAGTASWNYMQHDNGFCTGCHVMEAPFGRFMQAGKHDSLSCHACHQQSIFASMRQLYLWVAERPTEIQPHAKVPNRVCATCHVTDQPEVWQRIASTAGHRTHLESDSSALKNVQCVTCHGLEVHRFVPVDSTCAQAGCHVSQEIELGRMAGETDLHCATCHRFTLDVPALATRDSAARTLVPAQKQCFSCHQMQGRLAEYDPARDPHKGTCGMCHNPHDQKRPSDALGTCATAGCHADWARQAFHVGKTHRRVAEQCQTCHQPHQASVDASDCEGCHQEVRARSAGRRQPPVRFDTTKALRESAVLPDREDRPVRGKGDTENDDGRPPPPPPPWTQGPVVADTFPHAPHRKLACITCHASQSQHGLLTFEVPRGCQICHHQAPRRSDCAQCHRQDALALVKTATVTITTPKHAARPRTVSFRHESHTQTACLDCHTTPVTLTPPVEVRTCASCHESHHGGKATCASCHAVEGLKQAHPDPRDTHRACSACHTPAAIAPMVPTRSFCLTCHEPQQEHYAAKECTVCHFLAPPEQVRPQLTRRAGP